MKEEESDSETKLVCVLCGEPWEPSLKNICECGGFCTWGEKKGAKPMSWRIYPFKENKDASSSL
jgi:hypothetical protein